MEGGGAYEGALVNIAHLYRHSTTVHDWLMKQLSHLHMASSPQTTCLIITPLQTHLAHLQFTEAQQGTLDLGFYHSNS